MPTEGNYKVKVTVGDATVEIEGQKEGVVEIVSALSKIFEPRGAKTQSGPAGHHIDQGTPISPPPGRIVDVRSFFDQKKPSTHMEATTVATFYAQHVAPIDQKKETINPEALERLFIQANWKLPKAIGQVLVDTKRAGYLDATSQAGEYRLNPVGYNLVAHTLGTDHSPEPFRPKKKAKKTQKKR